MNNEEDFPDELELLEPQQKQQKQQRPQQQQQKQKVKNIQEPMEEEDNGGSSDNDDNDDGSHSSDQDESDEDENNLYDLMTDFFVNDNGENVATVLTNIQASLDQHAKCILKLTKVIQEFVSKNHK